MPAHYLKLGVLAAAFACALPAHAQFPTKPVRLIVNFAPGGTSDIIARTLQPSLSATLGVPVIVENRPGAQGALAVGEVGRAAPDGHTLILTTKGSLTQIPAMRSDVGYDPIAGFAAVTMLGDTPLLLLAHPSLPANDFKGFLEYAKRETKGVDLAVSGASITLAAAQLARDAKIDFVHVPYGSSVPALLAVLSGEVKVTITTASETLNNHVRSGRLKLLGITTLKPSPLVPGGVPIAQTLPGFSADTWFAIFAPGGTPRDVIASLNQAFRKAMNEPGIEQKLLANGLNPMASTPEELAQRVVTELAATRRLLQETKLKLE